MRPQQEFAFLLVWRKKQVQGNASPHHRGDNVARTEIPAVEVGYVPEGPLQARTRKTGQLAQLC
jgi:hypothetical protein